MEYWASLRQSDKYAISTMGRVWSASYGIMKTPPMNTGYPHCNIMINGEAVRVMIHQEMGKVFIPNPENKKTINHKNGIKSDNRLENLEWATSQEQNIHCIRVLGRKSAKNNHRRKIIMAVSINHPNGIEYNGIGECGRALQIPYQSIQRILKGQRRCYKGWTFKMKYDPKWKPKRKKIKQ